MRRLRYKLIMNEKAPEVFDMARSLFYAYCLSLRMRSCLYELLIKLRINYDKKNSKNKNKKVTYKIGVDMQSPPIRGAYIMHTSQKE